MNRVEIVRRPIAASRKPGFTAYAATPFMLIVLYALTSAMFWLLFKDLDTIFFFIILAGIFSIFMSLYALAPLKAKNAIRIITIFFISSLLFGVACVLGRQNFQIEGFFFYLLTGSFGGVMVHFLVGKIVGPLLVGRSWCGWGCWTLMLLDLLPFKRSRGWKKGLINRSKHIHFALSLALVAIMVFVFQYSLHDPDQAPDQPGPVRALYWFLSGNLVYYLLGVVLAISFKDNRAFCKYLCPVSVVLRIPSRLSMLRIRGDNGKCVRCHTCVNLCPANIDIPRYIEQGTRVKSTECLMCMKCIAVCPEGALCASIGFDRVTLEHLKNISTPV
jgi:ferredoxin-type protein NapH